MLRRWQKIGLALAATAGAVNLCFDNADKIQQLITLKPHFLYYKDSQNSSTFSQYNVQSLFGRKELHISREINKENTRGGKPIVTNSRFQKLSGTPEQIQIVAIEKDKDNNTKVNEKDNNTKVNEKDNNTKFILNEEALNAILLNEKFKDKPVVVISVAGSFRKGKSFLLNFFLRYLRHLSKTGDNKKWIESDQNISNKQKSGFNFDSGSDKGVTQGIWMWSEPFLLKDKNNNEVVVLLMDTQGIFDHNSNAHESTVVFALSSLISSVQIYNMMENIDSVALTHLLTFAEYGRILKKEANDSKPYQSLWFLIRDWLKPDYEFGVEGGTQKIKNILASNGMDKKINEIFDNIHGFLMPNPGNKVSMGKQISSNKDIDKDFLNFVQIFVEKILGMENLVVKRINQKDVTCSLLEVCFKEYVKAFNNPKLPKPEEVHKLYEKSFQKDALRKSKEVYENGMKKMRSQTRFNSEHPWFEHLNEELVPREQSDCLLKRFNQSI